jgi:hypothetical protein
MAIDFVFENALGSSASIKNQVLNNIIIHKISAV